MFVDRVRELRSLEQGYASNRAELYVLYGRRRVGKTELLQAFCQGKPHIFFVADMGTETSALADFTRQVSSFVYGRSDAIGPFPSWDAAFAFLADQAAQQRLVVVLDEFTYLVQANPAIPSILQRLWDHLLQKTKIVLILCGSYVGMIEKHVLSYRAPLYGRRTAQWHLHPLSFWDAMLFLPSLGTVDRVRAYAALGGVPAYLLQFSDQLALLDNVEQRILSMGTFLYDEPRFLLLQELTEPGRYFAMLEAIAGGHTRQNEIAQAIGLPNSSLPFYLATLRELGLIERAVPATEKHPDKSKRGIYRILDNYFRFWFRFVYPNRSILARGETGQVRQLVAQQLDEFAGPAFEIICQEYLWRLHSDGSLGFMPRSVGSWWNDREQIDIVAIGDKDILLGECKWTTRQVGTNILDDLRQKAAAISASGNWPNVHYALFTRSGFTTALQVRAADEGVRLFDLSQISP